MNKGLPPTAGERLLAVLRSVVLWAIGLFILLPLVAVVYVSFSPKSFLIFPPAGFSLRWYANIGHNAVFLTSFARSLAVGVLVTMLAGALALPAALALSRGRFRGRDAILTLLLAPLLLPTLVFALALLTFFSRLHLQDTLPGLVLAHTVVCLPYFLRSALVGLTSLDPSLAEASDILGATPWRTFRHVVLPLIRPSLLAGTIFAFIISFDQFTVSLFVVSYKQVTLPIALFNYLTQTSDPTVAAVSTLLVLFGLAASLLVHKLIGLDNLFDSGAPPQ